MKGKILSISLALILAVSGTSSCGQNQYQTSVENETGSGDVMSGGYFTMITE